MGKKPKIGKQRRDRFYQLAKESGFRSRSAFKLIQLNRKFNFLQTSKVLIDLCAAPGGWMQVAKQTMPASSIVVGVDLYPIKPVPGCIALMEDITTDKCKQALRKELEFHKADVILHDGAPNVGMNWLHDAYQQVCLTLHALKLATVYLRPGGWFITKVFRSKDYHPLLWVLKQLFKKVHATKPPASRTESAEIFVACQFYLAPHKIDPKFLDPKYVFKELEMDKVSLTNAFHPERKKKARPEGYADDMAGYNVMTAANFLACENAIEALQNIGVITFDDDDAISNHPKTTAEIKECCTDIKVLGRKEIRLLLAWWKALQEKDEDKKVKEEVEKKESNVESDDEKELEEIEKKIEEQEEENERALRKKKKRVQKDRTKLHEKLNLKMISKENEGPKEENLEVFNIAQIKTKEFLESLLDQNPDVVADAPAKRDKEKYKELVRGLLYSHLDSTGKFYKTGESDESNFEDDDFDISTGLGIKKDDDKEDTVKEQDKSETPKKTVRFAGLGDDSENDEDNEAEDYPLTTDLDYRDKLIKKEHQAQLWFEKDAFKNLIKETDEDYELDRIADKVRKQGGKIISDESTNGKMICDEQTSGKRKASALKGNVSKKMKGSDGEDTNNSDSDYDIEEFQAQQKESSTEVKQDKGGFEIVPKENKALRKKLSVEGMALGTMMVSSKKVKNSIIDGGWNRYAFNDEDLPDWFTLEEKQFMSKPMPVPKALAYKYKQKLKELDVRPIKKIIEAKARKKKRALRRLEKSKKKLEELVQNPDLSEPDRCRQIRRLYKRAKDKKQNELTYVVAKKHSTGARIKRPQGLEGRFRVVDARLKKDTRNTELKEKKKRGSVSKKGRKLNSRNKNKKKKK